MFGFKKVLLSAAFGLVASSASALTLDFDSGVAEYLNNDPNTNILVRYSQGGYTFGITQISDNFDPQNPDSLGANLFNTLFCVNGSGDPARCGGNDDGDLVPLVQGENGVAGNVLIRQETGNGILDDDAATSGVIRLTLESGPAFFVRGFSAVDEQEISIRVGTEVCGPIETGANRATGRLTCENELTSLLDVNDYFEIDFEGSGGVDSILIAPVPLPAGLLLLLTSLGSFAVWRRRRDIRGHATSAV